MKTIFALAAAIAALAGAPAASAHDSSSGHWEWRSQPASGPRSTVPSQVRVWVSDGEHRMADCDCGMMKTAAASCMMNMPGEDRSSSAG
jgi:hypothetical protein